MQRILQTTTLIGLLMPAIALPSEFQSHESIVSLVRSFVSAQTASVSDSDTKITVDGLDKRLKLRHCEKTLDAFYPSGTPNTGKTTVGVRCKGKRPWTVYVPVEIMAFDRIVVAQRPILRGEPIGRNDITLARKKMHAGRNRYFNDPALVLGMYAKRPIPEGKALSIHMLQAPHLVRRGQEVILLAKTAGLEVRMKGKALADGAKGDLIQVRNTKSRRIVEGVVTNQGVVRVGM